LWILVGTRGVGAAVGDGGFMMEPCAAISVRVYVM
jgi:hypothetical protein